MITLTRLDGKELVVNADHILTVEATPDTVLLLTSGQKLMVAEPVEEVVERVAAWRRRIRTGPTIVRDNVIPMPQGTPPPQE
jgi:flagellar protein FlbD